jgi:hypothetical protein
VDGQMDGWKHAGVGAWIIKVKDRRRYECRSCRLTNKRMEEVDGLHVDKWLDINKNCIHEEIWVPFRICRLLFAN